LTKPPDGASPSDSVAEVRDDKRERLRACVAALLLVALWWVPAARAGLIEAISLSMADDASPPIDAESVA
jgi:hypothetical protein